MTDPREPREDDPLSDSFGDPVDSPGAEGESLPDFDHTAEPPAHAPTATYARPDPRPERPAARPATPAPRITRVADAPATSEHVRQAAQTLEAYLKPGPAKEALEGIRTKPARAEKAADAWASAAQGGKLRFVQSKGFLWSVIILSQLGLTIPTMIGSGYSRIKRAWTGKDETTQKITLLENGISERDGVIKEKDDIILKQNGEISRLQTQELGKAYFDRFSTIFLAWDKNNKRDLIVLPAKFALQKLKINSPELGELSYDNTLEALGKHGSLATLGEQTPFAADASWRENLPVCLQLDAKIAETPEMRTKFNDAVQKIIGPDIALRQKRDKVADGMYSVNIDSSGGIVVARFPLNPNAPKGVVVTEQTVKDENAALEAKNAPAPAGP